MVDQHDPGAGVDISGEAEGLLAAVKAHEKTLEHSQALWKELSPRVGHVLQALLQLTQQYPQNAPRLMPLMAELEVVLAGGVDIVKGHERALAVEQKAAKALREVLD